MAAAAALARLEQKQPRARGPMSSQDSTRNQGELCCPWATGGAGEVKWSEASVPSVLEACLWLFIGPRSCAWSWMKIII